jgi:NNP family nitrate/nitrite transporter-like MFS transporter
MDPKHVQLKGSPGKGLFAATFGFFIGFAAVALYGPVAKEFKEVMQLSATQVGLLVAAPMLTGSLLRIPFGAWVDKLGGKKPMATLLFVSVIGMAGLATVLFTLYPDRLTNSYYPLILFLGLLSGFGIATFSVGIPQTAYWFPKSQQGYALGAYGGYGNIAPGLFTILISFLLPVLGLTRAYIIWFLFLLIGTIIYLIITHDAPYFQLIARKFSHEEAAEIARQNGQELIPSGNLIESLKISAKLLRTWALVFLYFTSFGGFLALTAWFPSYWRIFHNFDINTAGLLGGAGFSLLAAIIRVYGGKISDRYGGENVAIMSYSLVFLGALLLMFFTTFGFSLTGELLIGLGMGIGNAAVFKLVSKYVPEAVGGASGWVGGLGAFGGFVVPPILGLFVDKMGNIGYARGFVVYVLLAGGAILISVILKKTYGKSLH